MSETLHRKPVPQQAWHIAESVDPATERTISLGEAIFTAISELDALGWRGVAAFPNGQPVIEFSSKDDNTLAAVRPAVGDWLVLDVGLLRIFTAAQISDNYEAVEE